METQDKVIQRIWQDPEFKPALLIGGILFYLPILNLVIFGYLSLFMKKLVKKEGLHVFSWRDYPAILRESVRVFPLVLAYIILPLLIVGFFVFALQGLLDMLHLGIFSETLAYLPLSLLAIVLPPLFFNALKRYHKREDLRSCLFVYEISRISINQGKVWIKPLLLFWGVLFLGWPLVGFCYFAAVLPLIAVMVADVERA